MRLKTRFVQIILWSIAALPWASTAQPLPPSPAELIERANAAYKTQEERGWKYTYREDHSDSQLDKNGKAGPPATKTYEHIMLEGSDYKKLILIEGKPLDAKTEKKVEEDLEKERSARKRIGLPVFHRSVSLGGLDLLERLFDNKVTGEEVVDGRKTWRMESEPKPGYKAANKQEEEALSARRVNWFDQEDGFWMGRNSLFIRAANGFQPGSTIDIGFGKVGEAWLPGSWSMRVDMKWAPGIHGRVESRERYYDYKRFTVDTTVTPQ